MIRLALSGLVFLMVSGNPCNAAASDTRFVTDRLQLGLYQNKASGGKRLLVLVSGTRVELLAQEGMYAKVKTPSGKSGWVKSAFLVEQPPAVVRIKDLERENAELKEKVASLNSGGPNRVPELEAQIQTLKDESRRVQGILSQSRNERDRLSNRLRDNEKYLEQARLPVSKPVAIATALLLLLLSLALGLGIGKRIADSRVKRRLSGFRLA